MANRTPRALVASALLSALCGAGSANAQPSSADQKLAQSLFDQGRELMEAGRLEEACPKLAESQRLDPGGGTLLNLAMCHEKAGKTATAWSEYHLALSQAIAAGRADRTAIARERIAAIEPVVPHITVVVPASSVLAGLEVFLDGSALAQPAWGVAAAVDPGPHRVDARAPGRDPWHAELALTQPGENRIVHVPTLASPPVPAPASASTVSPSQASYGTAYRQPNPGRFTAWHYGAYSLATTAVLASMITGTMALSAHDTVKSQCLQEREFCSTQEGLDASSRERTYAWASTVTLGVAAVALVVAWSIPLDRSERRVQVGMTADRSGGGIAVQGALP
jgi:hypothetical protein